jgi:hypothetical protein
VTSTAPRKAETHRSSAGSGETPTTTATTFRLRRSAMGFFVVFSVFALVIGTIICASAIRDGAWLFVAFMAIWWTIVLLQARWFLFVMPWTIELEPDRVVFLSRAGRRREIAYADLQSVAPLPFDFQRQTARWVSPSQTVWSTTMFGNWHRLQSAVADRAPQAAIG